MSRVITVTVGPMAAASATNISASHSYGAAGNLTLDGSTVTGGVAILDQPRRVLITSAGNDSSVTFTVYGTDWNNQSTSEALVGASGAPGSVFTKTDFKTVTRIAISGASASTVTVGTNSTASTRPVLLDPFGFARVSQQVDASGGTVTASIENTLDDFIGIGEPPAMSFANASWVADTTLGTLTTAGATISSMASTPLFTRATITNTATSIRYTVFQPASPSI
jgi:hypothetical protein